MKLFKKEIAKARIIWFIVIVVILIILLSIFFVFRNQSTTVKQIRQKQLSSSRINLGSGKTADVYITLLAGTSRFITDNCGTFQSKEVLVGNFKLSVVRRYDFLGFIPIYKIYDLPLNNFTFASTGTGHPVVGNLDKISLNLSNYPADTIVVHQYENCEEHSSTLININSKTDKLQIFEARLLNSQIGTRFIIINGAKFTAVGRDAMDTFETNAGDKRHRFLRLHWKFDATLNRFVETGTSLE